MGGSNLKIGCLVLILAAALGFTRCGVLSSSDSNDAGGTAATPADTTPPTVKGLADANGAAISDGATIAINTTFTVTFSEAMDSNTVGPTTLSLTCGGTQVGGTVAESSDAVFSFTPTKALDNGASCTLTITTGVKDGAGNTLAANATFSLSTEAAEAATPAPDTTPPTITSVKDSSGTALTTTGSSVAVGTSFLITFSEAMDPRSLTTLTITLTSISAITGTVVAATNTDSIADNEFAFTPTSQLAQAAAFILTVVGGANGVKDAASNRLAADATYTVSTPDTTAPTVTSVKDSGGTAIKSSGSTVATSSALKMIFSEALTVTSITTTQITLSCGGSAVAGAVAAATDTDKITNNEFNFTPTSAIAQVSACTFTIKGGTTGVKDAAGNALAADATYTFTSGCASNDDFSNASSLSCFSFNNTTNQTNVVGTVQAAAITNSSSQLKFALTTANTTLDNGFNTLPLAAKQITGDFSVEITLSSVTFSNDGSGDTGLVVLPTMNEASTNVFNCTHMSDGCEINSLVSGVMTNVRDGGCDLGGAKGPYTPSTKLRITRTGNAFACFRKLSGAASFTQVATTQTNINMPATIFLGVLGSSQTTNGVSQYIFDDLTFNTGKAVGQD